LVQIELLEQMRCPYCGGGFHVRRTAARQADRLTYGLVECRCFAFPVVDGILLLSLGKAYGGAEEALQPYVPLQAAAVQHLERDDVEGLLAWMRRHAPFAAELIDGTDDTYLAFAERLERQLDREGQTFLEEYGKYEVLGRQRPPLLRRARAALSPADDDPAFPTDADYYAARYFAPRFNATALQLDAFPPSPRILSLCCGHGVFENLLHARAEPVTAVSVDAQLLNLLITRRFADHGGTYICHDVQFPLPFPTGAFDGVLASTCLPEIPAQRSFATEAIRVTSEHGWTDFDSIWNTDMGVHRVDTERHYRFAQNFFSSLADYLPFFETCAGPERRVGLDAADTPAAYLHGPRWQFGADAETAVAAPADYEISVVVLGSQFPGFVEPELSWLRAEKLAVSPAFAATRTGTQIALQRQPSFGNLHPNFAPKGFAGYPASATIDLSRTDERAYLAELFAAAWVSLVPSDFTSDSARFLTAAGTTPTATQTAERGTSG